MLFERLLLAASYSTPAPSGGSIYSWGSNATGQTGHGTTSGYTTVPTVIAGSAGTWTQISATVYGSTWSAASNGAISALRSDGTVWSWGNNGGYGLIGLGSTAGPVLVPTQIPGSNWVSVAINGLGFLGVQSNGTLWSSGYDSYGALGMGGPGNYHINLTQVGVGTTWAKVFTSSLFTTFIIDNAGHLWTMGTPTNYENGLANPGVLVATPTQVGTATWSKIITIGDSSYSGDAPWTIGLQTNGTIWAVGYNTNGQTGLGTSSGAATTFTQIGSATTWTDIGAVSSFITSSNSASFGIKSDGTMWGWGTASLNGNGTSYLVPTQIGSGTNWSKVCGGSTSSATGGSVGYTSLGYGLALQSNGTIWSWGSNNNYQAGQGASVITSSPTQIGSGTTWTLIGAGGCEADSASISNLGCYGFAVG
jgi:alpha-tubulin suppressor-like RCC1 family protein